MELIGNSYLQHCGDILVVLEKTKEKKDGKYLYRCQFQKYLYEIFVLKSQILKGTVNNPQIEQVEFIDKLWPQNCGDTLKVIKKSKNKVNNNYLWKCEFIKYPHIVEVTKQSIQLGMVTNPIILQNEFIGKEFKQTSGVLKVIRELRKDNKQYFEVEFNNPYYKTLAQKGNIIRGEVYNYALDDQYIGKEIKQNCGDILKIVEKTNKRNSFYNILWKGNFINYSCEVYFTLTQAKNKEVENPNLPWKSKDNFLSFLNLNFELKGIKPTILELSNSIGLSRQSVGQYIIKYNLQDYIKFDCEKSENNLKFEIEEILNLKSIKYNDNKYEIDIYFPEQKLGIEYNGNYWHSELFKENNYHQEKSLYFREKNIRIFHIFEHEWNLKKDIILSFFNNNKHKIFARKCTIKELDYKTYAPFCNENHLQGECGAKVKLGLYFNNELVQIMSFGTPRFTNDYDWEIIRECSKKNYIIIGGKEKLWSYFIKKYNPKNCISYCDFSKFDGHSYLKLNFRLERLNKPGFWWYDNKSKQVIWRNPYNHEELKEKYIKVYDCGQLVFGWENKRI